MIYLHVLSVEDLAPGAVYNLPHEFERASGRMTGLTDAQRANVAEMMEARAGSTENMGHDDGGQESAWGEANNLATRAKPVELALRGHVLVEYPHAGIDTVTIGSRVLLAYEPDGPEYAEWFDVTGPVGRYDEVPGNLDTSITTTAYSSPIGLALFGHKVGDTVTYTASVHGRKKEFTVTIHDIDQDAQRLAYAPDAVAV